MYLMSCLPQLVYQKDGHEIEHLEKYKALHLSWYGHVDSEAYQHMFNKMLELGIEYQAENWLCDARDADFMELGEKEWRTHYFTKEIMLSPVKKFARIASGNFENETYISSVISNTLNGARVSYKFSYQPDACAAFEWFEAN